MIWDYKSGCYWDYKWLLLGSRGMDYKWLLLDSIGMDSKSGCCWVLGIKSYWVLGI